MCQDVQHTISVYIKCQDVQNTTSGYIKCQDVQHTISAYYCNVVLMFHSQTHFVNQDWICVSSQPCPGVLLNILMNILTANLLDSSALNIIIPTIAAVGIPGNAVHPLSCTLIMGESG